MRLDGKRVLITGGASGIGRAIGSRVIDEGGRVLIADQLVDGDSGVAVDVVSEPSVVRMMELTAERLGGLDVLVHCAGIGSQKNLLDCDLTDWKRIIDVNLTGTFICCREAARMMSRQKAGSIVVIGSSSAVRPGVNSSAYAASKGGVVNFVRAAAVDLAPHGIRVNGVSPGPIDTDLVQRMHSPEFRSSFTALIPQRRYGRPGEVAGAVIFLASDDASFITGSIMAVDGGFSSAGVIA